MMNTKRSFAVQSLIATVILNGILLGVVYALIGDTLQAQNQTFLFFAIGIVITLVLWFVLYSLGSRLIGQEVPVSVSAGSPAPSRPTASTPARTATPETPPVSYRDRVKPQEAAMSAEAGAAQSLAILQREGRFIDFLQE